jgi:hypothetical protein
MSAEKISASWMATLSGRPASSVAANKELRMLPLDSRTCEPKGTEFISAVHWPACWRSVRRVKWVRAWSLLAAGKRATSS